MAEKKMTAMHSERAVLTQIGKNTGDIVPQAEGQAIEHEGSDIEYGNPWTGDGWDKQYRPEARSTEREGLKSLKEGRETLMALPAEFVENLLKEAGATDITEDNFDQSEHGKYIRKFKFKHGGTGYTFSGSNAVESYRGDTYQIDWSIRDEENNGVYDSPDGLKDALEKIEEQTNALRKEVENREHEVDPVSDRELPMSDATKELLEGLKAKKLPTHVPTPPGSTWELVTRKENTDLRYHHGKYEATIALSVPELGKIYSTLPTDIEDIQGDDGKAFRKDPVGFMKARHDLSKEIPVGQWDIFLASDGRVFATPHLSLPQDYRNEIAFPPLEIGRLPVEKMLPDNLAKMLGAKNKMVTAEEAKAIRRQLKELPE